MSEEDSHRKVVDWLSAMDNKQGASQVGAEKDGSPGVKCPGCEKFFRTVQQLQQHGVVHTGERKYVCEVEGCKKKFKQLSHLNQHKRLHSGEKPYRCTIDGCGKAFTQQANLNHHYKTARHASTYVPSATIQSVLEQSTLGHAGPSGISLPRTSAASGADNEKFECDICGIVLPNVNKFEIHREKNHPEYASLREVIPDVMPRRRGRPKAAVYSPPQQGGIPTQVGPNGEALPRKKRGRPRDSGGSADPPPLKSQALDLQLRAAGGDMSRQQQLQQPPQQQQQQPRQAGENNPPVFPDMFSMARQFQAQGAGGGGERAEWRGEKEMKREESANSDYAAIINRIPPAVRQVLSAEMMNLPDNKKVEYLLSIVQRSYTSQPTSHFTGPSQESSFPQAVASVTGSVFLGGPQNVPEHPRADGGYDGHH